MRYAKLVAQIYVGTKRKQCGAVLITVRALRICTSPVYVYSSLHLECSARGAGAGRAGQMEQKKKKVINNVLNDRCSLLMQSWLVAGVECTNLRARTPSSGAAFGASSTSTHYVRATRHDTRRSRAEGHVHYWCIDTYKYVPTYVRNENQPTI